MNVVVCGAGVIGASIAYFLAERGVAATLVERNTVACAASGKSGGFIARDWCDGQPQAELACTSFDLHEDLARTLDADYGYKRIDTLLVAGSDRGGVERYRGMASPDWLDGRCAVHSAIGSTRTTATIHPERFTRALVDAACARGTRLVHGTADQLFPYTQTIKLGRAFPPDADVTTTITGLFAHASGRERTSPCTRLRRRCAF